MSVGGSNAPGGITIDLRGFDDIVIDEDLGSARVGTANTWRKVYEVLEPLGRTAVGGRNPTVGVGGFILGGGISFVSRRYGWALDNVRNFEVGCSISNSYEDVADMHRLFSLTEP